MHKFILTLAAFASLAGAGPANAFFGNAPKFADKPVEAAYRIEAYGTDFRVYEWTPAGNPDMLCVAVYASMPVGHVCTPKTQAADRRVEGRLGLERVEPDTAYRVQSLGLDFRVYEWTTQSDPGKVCSANFARAGVGTVSCYDKKDWE